jgi:hypothetical protein
MQKKSPKVKISVGPLKRETPMQLCNRILWALFDQGFSVEQATKILVTALRSVESKITEIGQRAT